MAYVATLFDLGWLLDADDARLVLTLEPDAFDAEPARLLLECAQAASRPESLDPMERAVRETGVRSAAVAQGQHAREYPLTPACPAMAHAWSIGEGHFIAAKGAPEAIARLCALSPDQRVVLLDAADALAAQGLRVLAVASALASAGLPPQLQSLGLQWRGLLAFADPLRSGVAEAIAEASGAGIRVLMLTGDHASTAAAIARQSGLETGNGVLTGADIDALADQALGQRLSSVSVYARVRPEQKLRLVQALRDDGKVVAMTGDGVNDAPALVAADVGIAMGQRGTDVAREAAAIVLLDDNFVSIVRAVGLGRSIYDNIQRAVRYIMAVHVPITGLALLPLLTGGPLLLLPLHVVFLELIIDPACTIAFEREAPAPGLMQRPPRPPSARLLDLPALLRSLLQGLAMFAVVAAVYLGFRLRAHRLGGDRGGPGLDPGGQEPLGRVQHGHWDWF